MDGKTVVIVGAARTPQGKFLGVLKDFTAPELGAIAIQAALQRARLAAADVEEVLMGCVLAAGLGQAPARQAALRAQLPQQIDCTTLNKVCGSGMKAVMLAHDAIVAGTRNIVIAGGMESMSNAPYLLPQARQGYRLGHQHSVDHMLLDGLEDAYAKGTAMGVFAEACAKEYHFSRPAQDAYALTSLERAREAINQKLFAAEIAPVTVTTKQGTAVIEHDERPQSVKPEKIALLPPAFAQHGTITAANASALADGAAALVLMTAGDAEARGLVPLARIVGHASFAGPPPSFTTAPIYAIEKLLTKIDWTINQVDLFEINEAFAVVTMAALRDLRIPPAKLNIYGGACALGHPLGATGARIIVTLLNALKNCNLNHGIAALCIGGGEATAVAIEIL